MKMERSEQLIFRLAAADKLYVSPLRGGVVLHCGEDNCDLSLNLRPCQQHLDALRKAVLMLEREPDDGS